MLIKFTLNENLTEGHGRAESIVNMWHASRELRLMKQESIKHGMTPDQWEQRLALIEIGARLIESQIEDHVHAMLRSYIQDVMKE